MIGLRGLLVLGVKGVENHHHEPEFEPKSIKLLKREKKKVKDDVFREKFSNFAAA